MTIVEQLEQLLIADERSQKALARHLGVSFSTINSFLNKRLLPSLQMSELIASEYGYRVRMAPANYPGNASDQARALIREQGVCADRIARRCGVQHQTATRLLSGRYNVQMKTAMAVAEAFGQSWTLERISEQ